MDNAEAIKILEACTPIWVSNQTETVEQFRLAINQAITALNDLPKVERLYQDALIEKKELECIVERIDIKNMEKILFYATNDCTLGKLGNVFKHQERCEKQSKAIVDYLKGDGKCMENG